MADLPNGLIVETLWRGFLATRSRGAWWQFAFSAHCIQHVNGAFGIVGHETLVTYTPQGSGVYSVS
jgi:hypothetical protein